MVFACNLLCASANAREYEEQVRIGDKMGALQNVFSPNLSWRTMISSFFSAFDQFRTMTPIDVVDILVVAYIIYRVMKLLKDTSAARLAKGILILVLIMLFASFLRLTMISWLLRNALSVGVFAVVVIFQPELRRLLEQIGKGNLSRMLIPDTDPNVVESMIVATVSACADMSRTKTGALIVFERKERLGEIIATGTRVDAAPSAELIKNIFFKNSPLHDGAMIVRAGRVCAAGCVLPLSGNQGLSRDLGTRHRAAVGMSETADSVLVVVSEETGAISVAIGGMLKRSRASCSAMNSGTGTKKAVLPPSATSGREVPASEEEFYQKARFSAEAPVAGTVYRSVGSCYGY